MNYVGPTCIQSCAYSGYCTESTGIIYSTDLQVTYCDSAGNNACTWYTDPSCSVLTPGSDRPVPDKHFYCNSATEYVWCKSLYSFFANGTRESCSPLSPGPVPPSIQSEGCIRSCDNLGLFFLSWLTGTDHVACYGPYEGWCSLVHRRSIQCRATDTNSGGTTTATNSYGDLRTTTSVANPMILATTSVFSSITYPAAPSTVSLPSTILPLTLSRQQITLRTSSSGLYCPPNTACTLLSGSPGISYSVACQTTNCTSSLLVNPSNGLCFSAVSSTGYELACRSRHGPPTY